MWTTCQLPSPRFAYLAFKIHEEAIIVTSIMAIPKMQPSAFSTLHSIDMIDAGKMIDSAQGKDLVTIQLNLEMYVDVMGLQ